MRSDGSRLRRLTATPACKQNPAWSPNGLQIAYEQDTSVTTTIVVSSQRGGDRRVIGEGTFPTWSPDGQSLAFLTSKTIEIVDPETGSVKRSLQPDVPYLELEDGLAWSPDGSRLLFGFRDNSETKPVTHIGIVDIDGATSNRLTLMDTFPDIEPDWQPICSVYGTDGDDVLEGTAGDDLICALRGNDRIRAGGGNDTVLAGDGTDSIVGGPGQDWLFGAAGNDRLYARDTEADILNGGPGSDRVWPDSVDTVSEAEERRS